MMRDAMRTFLLRAAAALLPALATSPAASEPRDEAAGAVAARCDSAIAVAAAGGGVPCLESSRQGPKMVLDWTVTESAPAQFQVLRPDGRLIATRAGKRSVQGWIASIRVAGWPPGVYLVTAEAGATRSREKFILR